MNSLPFFLVNRFIRLHVNDICSQSILNQIRDRVVYSFKQQPDFGALMRDCHNEFAELIEKTIEKYCGAM